MQRFGRKRISMRILLLTLLLFVALAAPALAVDGVLEINQTCAVSTGCFGGDVAGYPVTITEPGSYRLTSNLATESTNMTAILITTSDVAVDLNGFTIACVFGAAIPLSCREPSGSAGGVMVDNTATRFRVTVQNGIVRDMGNDGVRVGPQGRVEKVHAANNGGSGIVVGSSSIVVGSTAYQNGSHGISASAGSTVSGNTAYDNESIGIWGSSCSTLLSNAAYDNVVAGIVVFSDSTVSGNTAHDNEGLGIQAANSSTVSGNTASGNGGDGIEAGLGSTVQSNTVRSNGGYGLNLDTRAAYRENVITGNTTGTVDFGVNRGDNYCDGPGVVSAFCP